MGGQRLVTLAAMLSLPACSHGLSGVVATVRVSLPARSSLAAPRIRSASMRQGQEPHAPGGRGVFLTLALCWVAAHIAPFVLGVPPANAATPALPEGFGLAAKEGGGLGGLDNIQVHMHILHSTANNTFASRASARAHTQWPHADRRTAGHALLHPTRARYAPQVWPRRRQGGAWSASAAHRPS